MSYFVLLALPICTLTVGPIFDHLLCSKLVLNLSLSYTKFYHHDIIDIVSCLMTHHYYLLSWKQKLNWYKKMIYKIPAETLTFPASLINMEEPMGHGPGQWDIRKSHLGFLESNLSQKHPLSVFSFKHQLQQSYCNYVKYAHKGRPRESELPAQTQ